MYLTSCALRQLTRLHLHNCVDGFSRPEQLATLRGRLSGGLQSLTSTPSCKTQDAPPPVLPGDTPCLCWRDATSRFQLLTLQQPLRTVPKTGCNPASQTVLHMFV